MSQTSSAIADAEITRVLSRGNGMHRQAEANLVALIESTEDLLGSVDLEYRLLTCNGAFKKYIEDLFGVTPELGMRPDEMLTSERAALWPEMTRNSPM